MATLFSRSTFFSSRRTCSASERRKKTSQGCQLGASVRVDEPMLSMVATLRKSERRWGASVNPTAQNGTGGRAHVSALLVHPARYQLVRFGGQPAASRINPHHLKHCCAARSEGHQTPIAASGIDPCGTLFSAWPCSMSAFRAAAWAGFRMRTSQRFTNTSLSAKASWSPMSPSSLKMMAHR